MTFYGPEEALIARNEGRCDLHALIKVVVCLLYTSTIIAELGQKLQEFPHFYLVDVTGLNAEKTSALRRKLSLIHISPLRAGMTLTDEPGLYLAGKFGVRIKIRC